MGNIGVSRFISVLVYLRSPTNRRQLIVQGLEPFEFIGIGSGMGSPKIKYLFWFGSGLLIKKKIKVSVPNNFGTGSR